MILRHATPARNLPGILRAGLLCSKSRTARPAVWFHAPSASAWAILHVSSRHGCRAESVIILECTVPRKWLCRCRHRGMGFITRDLPPGRIRRVLTAQTITGPSAA